MAGKADFWADGQWNFYCDLCGAKTKSYDGVKTWNNLYVCRHHKEIRNPQDFLRGVKEDPSVPWTRPTSVGAQPFVCTFWGSTAYANLAEAGCAIAGNAPLTYAIVFAMKYPTPPDLDPSFQASGIPGYAIPGFSIPANPYLGIGT